MLKRIGNMDENSFGQVYRRIQKATNTKTQKELAAILEVHQSSISDAKRRNALPPGWFLALFEKFGLSQDWLRYGIGPMYLRTEQGYMPQASLPEDMQADPAHYGDPAAKCAITTVYSMHCRPNGDGRIPHLDPAGKLALPCSFVGSDMLVLRMHGNDMAPIIQQGAYFGVATTEIQAVSGGIFVLKEEHVGLLVRRVFLDCSSALRYVLRTDDAKFPESILQPEEFAERIVGRVRWVLQAVAS